MNDAREILSRSAIPFVVGPIRIRTRGYKKWSVELVAITGPMDAHRVVLRDDEELASQVASMLLAEKMPLLARLRIDARSESDRSTYQLLPTSVAEACALLLGKRYASLIDVNASMIAVLAAAYYAKPGNEVGGALHVVLDDGNVEDEHVRSCTLNACSAGDVDGAALGTLLLLCSRTQRRKVYLNHGNIDVSMSVRVDDYGPCDCRDCKNLGPEGQFNQVVQGQS